MDVLAWGCRRVYNERRSILSGVNNEYKDRLFGAIFGRTEHRKWTLSLYNAINGSSYEDPEEIVINTMDDSVYMGMKNDVSFILQGRISIYEQQSSFNPNMPLREFMYAGRLYGKHVREQQQNVYGEALIHLPVPRLVVFYNGSRNKKNQILRLSDAFPDEIKKESDIEVKVRMININYGHNRELMKKCKPLAEYAWFVDMIRKNMDTMEIEAAVDRTIDAMPEDYEIKSYLMGNREEVRMYFITEYDEEEHMKLVRRDAREEGREEGIEQGIEQGIKGFIEDKLEDGIPIDKIREKLKRIYQLPPEKIEEYLEKYAANMAAS